MENTRHRIEHCAMVTDELLSRIKKLNIVPISNPIFLYEFGDGYMTNYGKENAYRMFTCKSFLITVLLLQEPATAQSLFPIH